MRFSTGMVSRMVAVAIAAVALGGAAGAQTLKIGVIAPMTGPAAPWGLAMAEGAKILAADYNAQGGLKIGTKTYKVEIVALDDQYKAAEALSAYQRLVNRDGVKHIAIAAGVSTLAIKPQSQDDDVIVMTAGYVASLLDPKAKNMYRMWGIPADYYPPIYSWLKDNTKERRIAVLNPDDESSRETSALTQKLLKQNGYTIVNFELYEKSVRDFLPVLTKVVNAQPEIIDLGATAPATAALMIRQVRELGFKGPIFIPGSSAWREILDGAGSAAAEGVINMVYVDPSNEAYRSFAAKYKQAVGQEPNESIAPYTDGVNVLIRAIQASGSADDTSKFDAGFRKALPMKSIQGDTMTIGGGMNHGIDNQVAAVRSVGVIRNGQLQVVGKIQ
jgi:branched-chain amino acid transport system substrate-binding protein